MMTEQDVRQIVERVMREQAILSRYDASSLIASSVASTLTQLGIDHEEPIEFQKDMAHSHKLRMAAERIEALSWKVVLTTLISGTLALIWIGMQDKIKTVLGMTP